MKRVVMCPPSLYNKVKQLYDYFDFNLSDNGYGRRFKSGIHFPDVERQEIFELFGFSDLYEEPKFKTFVGENYLKGASVHKHKDPAPEGYVHVRCNIAVQMPESGGNPVIDGKEIDVNTGDIWICFASEETHSSKPLISGKRKVVSVGALIKESVAIPALSAL